MMCAYQHAEVTKEILGAAFEVHGILGPGFLETVYEKALANELGHRGLTFQRQMEVPVLYKGDLVGMHRLDMVVAGCVVVELKAVKALEDIHTAVVLSYLAAAGLSVGLVLNFAKPSLEFKRVARSRGAS